jgi:outer membrane protein insertion porin family
VERGGNATIAILLEAEPGPVFRFGQIQVQGSGSVTGKTFLRRLGLKQGQPYHGQAFDAALGRLWETSAFEDIDPVFEPRADGTLDVMFKIEEAPAKQISTTIGYGQWDQGFVSLNYSDRNFLGSLNRFSLDGFLSTKSYGLVATLSDPWLFFSGVTGTSRASYTRRETPAYKSTVYGGALLLEKTSTLRNQTGWSAGLEWRDTSDSTVFADDQLDGAPVDYRLGAVSFSQTFDRRNDPLMPMKGFFLSWDGLLASEVLLGDVSFARLRGQATYYLPLQKIQTGRIFVPFFVVNHRAGIIAPFAGTKNVPVQERFFLGGPNSIRSFQLDGMAPRDSEGQPGGGLLSLLVNAELQIPVFRALYLVGFVDVGNLAPTSGTFAWDDTRVAGGLGARFYTPLGAVRLDYGYNLIRGEGDPTGAWQFGFGFTF